jgi:signal transduction histidine kinase
VELFQTRFDGLSSGAAFIDACNLYTLAKHGAADKGQLVRAVGVPAPPTDVPQLLFDPEALSRAILNVVTNALDAVEDRDGAAVTIHVACDTEAERVRVIIGDNGEGMAPETIAEIFNLFVSTKGARGTGLGLTVSRKILREHGGDIRVTSVPGEGSTFVLEFPLRTGDGGQTISDFENNPGRP